MQNINSNVLSSLIGKEPDKDCGAASINRRVNIKSHGWWSERIGFAILYACTDSVKENKHNTYDVILKGIPELNDAPFNTHEFRKNDKNIITITDVYYCVKSGTADERIKRIKALIRI